MGSRSETAKRFRQGGRGLGMAIAAMVAPFAAISAAATELSEAQVRAAIADRHALVQQSIDTAAGDLTGKTVRLSGVVARPVHVVGDDFGQLSPLFIDLDAEVGGQPGPDVLYWAPLFAIMALEPGQRVGFTGVVQGFSVEADADGRGVLLLQVVPLDRDHPLIRAE